MLFQETDIAGAFVVEIKQISDDRGFFGRAWCSEEFRKRGLSDTIAQINTGVSTRAGTLRGMHYQLAPHAEVKVVQCTRGAVYDVAVDLRPESPTFKCWTAVELTDHNYRAFYIPEGCAHGYLTLSDDAVLTYMTSRPYAPTAAKGVRFDDPAFGIRWPGEIRVISTADRNWPDFTS
jgi:dTDP-4-dehydrorhamnose 3,5-epimerase